MNGLAALLKSLGPARLAAMGAVAIGLIGFFAYITLRFNEVNEAPLYTGLTLEDSAAIIAELDSANVAYRLLQNGTVIMVPDQDVTRLRMQFAEQGLPAGGGVGYEIFDKTDALGTTSFVQNVNRLRALEGELARTIRAINRVESARVHLVLPERQLFRQNEQKPTASIVLKTRGVLEPSQIRAIQHLVASAVNGLEPTRISIIDEAGRLLAEGSGDETTQMMAAAVDERTAGYQKDVEARVREIVESVVGPGRARVKVAAELDFNRISETRDTFDPNGQVVRSTQSREENSASSEPQPNDQVTAGNQIPNANQPAGGSGASATQNANTSEETINYEISKTTRTQVTEAGGIRRLSVAVVVDGRYQTGADGVQTYVARDQQELDRISALVRTAMGFDQNRGDQVEVVNLQFAEGPPATETDAIEPGMFEFSKDDLVRFAEMGVMFILTLLVLLFAVRPLIKRILSPEVVTEHREITTTVTGPNGQAITMLLNAEGQLVPADAANAAAAVGLPPPEAGPPSRIEEAKAKGAEQMDQVRRVGSLVEENPNEAAIIIRTWLSEAA